MAKKVVATLKKGDSKSLVKAYKLVKNPKTGAYAYKVSMISADVVKEHFEKKEY